MGALTNVYVAATSGSDGTGNGTSGNPYKTTQFTLNNHGRDATNGNYIYLSGNDVLSGSLSYSTWGASSFGAQTVLRNWVGGPDGQGHLDGNAGNFAISAANSYVSYWGLKLSNTGSATIITLGNEGYLVDCEIFTSTNTSACISTTQYAKGRIFGCNIYNVRGKVLLTDENDFFGNYVATGPTNNFTDYAVWSNSQEVTTIARNIITVSGAMYGILAGGRLFVYNNSILCTTAGTGGGIYTNNSGCSIVNNVCDGFSGVGGKGFHFDSDVGVAMNNAVYNCTTAYSLADQIFIANDNETLSASPFAKSGSNTFANRKVYFEAVDTGNVWGGAYPDSGLDKGAVQHAGGGATAPNFNIITQSA